MKVYTPETVRMFIDKCLTLPDDKLEKRKEVAPEILNRVGLEVLKLISNKA